MKWDSININHKHQGPSPKFPLRRETLLIWTMAPMILFLQKGSNRVAFFLLVLIRKIGNEPRGPLKGNHNGWFVGVIPTFPTSRTSTFCFTRLIPSVTGIGRRLLHGPQLRPADSPNLEEPADHYEAGGSPISLHIGAWGGEARVHGRFLSIYKPKGSTRATHYPT